MKQADNFDLKKYLVENKLGEDKPTVGEYVAVMGPDFEDGVNLLKKAWDVWKEGSETKPEMIDQAKQDIITFIKSKLV
jgi:hypothetical protein